MNETAIRRARWLLLLPPCLPGLLMLLLGWIYNQRARFPPPGDLASRRLLAHAHQQAEQLYTAGIIALLGGVLMAAFIAWKILWPSPLPDEEDPSVLESR